MRTATGLVITAFVFGACHAACACDCAPPPAPKNALENATAVFLGKAADIEHGDGPVVVTFEVETNFKGVKTKKVTVRTGASSAACGFVFTEGEVYLVYCYGEADSLETSICTRTQTASYAKDDLKELGEGEAIED
jgi:hypothetical protein